MMRNIALYCHFPWCIQKCPYCDFNSYTLRDGDSFGSYIDALCKDIQHCAAENPSTCIQSIFLGGGTPSLFRPMQIERALEHIHKCFKVSHNCEITMEMNPNTHAEHSEPLQSYRKIGINRLSIGAQSFNNDHLKSLGRTHGARDIFSTYNNALSAQFNSINIDIMYALGKQTLDQAMADLATACELAPEHISWYQLTIEPNTVFYSQPPTLPEHDTCADIMQHGLDYLQARDYHRYEISAFSQANMECRHNTNYWSYGDYIGVGAGSHSKLTYGKSAVRYHRHRSPKAYLLAPTAKRDYRILTANDHIFEFMLNRTRLLTPFTAADFENTTQLPFSILQKQLALAIAQGFIGETASGYALTTSGLLYLNDCQLLFLCPED